MNLNSGYLELFAEPQHQSHNYTPPDFGKISKYCYLTSHTQRQKFRSKNTTRTFYHTKVRFIMKSTLCTEMYTAHWAPKVTFINVLLGLYFLWRSDVTCAFGRHAEFSKKQKDESTSVLRKTHNLFFECNFGKHPWMSLTKLSLCLQCAIGESWNICVFESTGCVLNYINSSFRYSVVAL